MSDYKLATPVLFLIFNRLDTTKEVFEKIKRAKPQRLYIACDGPREDKVGEEEKVKAVRNYVLSNIDWRCDVKTLFRDKNLGCGRAVSEAITWFFENEKMGIILEDDCLPSVSFFRFCEELLYRYKDEERIWHIGGSNFQEGIWRDDGDYYFSIYSHIWGWASWADRWRNYDFNIVSNKDDMFIRRLFPDNKKALKYWLKIFKMMRDAEEISTWDHQWLFSIWSNNGLSIIPNKNLVLNIGLKHEEATHTKGDLNFKQELEELKITKHPHTILANKEADNYFIEKYLKSFPNIVVRGFRKIFKILGLKHDL